MLYSTNLLISSMVNKPLKRICFGIICGGLLSLTLAFFGLGFWAWFGLIPVLMLIKSSESYTSACLESFVFFVSYNIISFLWLAGLHPLTWQGLTNLESLVVTSLAIITPSLFHAGILLIFTLIARTIYIFKTEERSHELNYMDAILLSFIWVIIEHKIIFNLGRDLGAFFIPVNLLAYSQYNNKALIQSCNVYGALGLEFVMVFCNTYLSNFFNIQSTNTNILKSRASEFNIKNPYFGVKKVNIHARVLTVFACFIFALYVYGFNEIINYDKLRKSNAQELQSFAIVQADYSAAASRSSDPNPENLLKLQLELSSKITTPIDFMVWSEGSIPIVEKSFLLEGPLKDLASNINLFAYGSFDIDPDGNYYNSINFLDYVFAKDYSDYNNFSRTIISDKPPEQKIQDQIPDNELKSTRTESSSPIDETISEASNKEHSNFESEDNIELESDMYLAGDQRLSNLESITTLKYFKKNLVPFGEYTPFVGLLPKPLKMLAKSTIGEGFKVSPLKLKPTKTQRLQIANSICFELLFPKLISNQVNQNADLILNINDLSWFNNFLKGELIKKQFLAIAVFRAIENKKELVLAGNTGYSALIDATGRIRHISNSGRISILLGKFLPNQLKSSYTLYGW
jgi:apolipoprotein N-acyltransferase